MITKKREFQGYSVLLAVGIALASTLSACDKDDDGIDGLVGDVATERNAQIDLLCGDCSDELGYASQTECQQAYGYFGPSVERCVVDAYNRDKAASRSYLKCISPLEDEYTACLTDRLDCTDLSSADVCGNDYEVGERDCIEVPQTIKNALDDCFN